MKLIINKPYIKGNRLFSKIEYDEKSYNMFFEVEPDYVQYLCNENANAFLISLIPFIVKHNYDVEIRASISSQLYYQITNYLLPLLCKSFNKKLIKIQCTELKEDNFSSSGVGASVSCGVDSFYTLLKNQNNLDYNYNITHLTFFNAGSHGEYGGADARNRYNERLKFIRKFCDENNYKLVTVDSNMNELIMMDHKKTHSFRTLGCVYALQKLFNKYYFASGYYYDEMKIDEDSCGHYDTLNVQSLTTPYLKIYCSGMEVSRQEKVNFIAKQPITYNWLNVCISTAENCGMCNKCMRTMMELDAISMLEKYSSCFPIEKFYKNKNKIIGSALYTIRKNKDCDAQYLKETIIAYKQNGKKISKKSYLYSYLPTKQKIKNLLKKVLPKKIKNYFINKKYSNKINDGWMD